MAQQQQKSKPLTVQSLRLTQSLELLQKSVRLTVRPADFSLYHTATQTDIALEVDSVLYYRGLFDSASFGWRESPAKVQPSSYKDYVSASSCSQVPDGPHKYPLLRPLAGTGADKFLEWIELGALEALRRGYLAALQIRVLDDSPSSESMLECHTLMIMSKKDDKDSFAVQAHQKSKRQQGQPVYTLAGGNRELAQNTMHLIGYCNQMGVLPTSTRLEMVLYYNEKRPRSWHPCGFIENDPNEIVHFAKSKSWSPQEMIMQNINTPFHRLSFSARYLVPESGTESLGSLNDFLIPSGIQGFENYKPRLALLEKKDAAGIHKEDQESTSADELARPQSLRLCNENSVHVLVTRPGEQQPQGNASHNTNTTKNQSYDLETMSTQNSKLDAARARVNALADSKSSDLDVFGSSRRRSAPEVSQDTRQHFEIREMMTKVRPSGSCPETQLPLGTQTHRKGELKNQRNPIPFHDNQRICFSEQTTGQLQSRMQPQGKARIMSCECCNQRDDKMLICCGYCKKLKHARCYGYTDVKDPRQPKTHACYTCLFGEGSQAFRTQNLATIRLVLAILKDKSNLTRADLKYESGLDKGVIKRALDKLSMERHVNLEKKQRINPTFLSNEGVMNSKVLENYYNPATGIEDFLIQPQTGTSQAKLSPPGRSRGSSTTNSGHASRGLHSRERSETSFASQNRSNGSVPRVFRKRTSTQRDATDCQNAEASKRRCITSAKSRERIVPGSPDDDLTEAEL